VVMPWKDSYKTTLLGAIRPDAYNYAINMFPESIDTSIEKHQYVVYYYMDTIDGKYGDSGFYWSQEGGGWGDKPLANGQIVKQSEEVIDAVAIQVDLEKISQDSFDTVGSWYKSGEVYLTNSTAILVEHSPAYLFDTQFFIPDDVNAMSFDFLFKIPGDGDYLSVNFNEDLLFWYEGDWMFSDDFLNSGLIDIGRYSGQTGRLTFALNSVGESNSVLWLDNLSLYNYSEMPIDAGQSTVPEPNTIVLFGFGIFGLWRRRFFRENQV